MGFKSLMLLMILFKRSLRKLQLGCSAVLIPDQTRGMYNRRRDGKLTKILGFKAAANRAADTAVACFFML